MNETGISCRNDSKLHVCMLSSSVVLENPFETTCLNALSTRLWCVTFFNSLCAFAINSMSISIPRSLKGANFQPSQASLVHPMISISSRNNRTKRDREFTRIASDIKPFFSCKPFFAQDLKARILHFRWIKMFYFYIP